jgi:hypothetical protein
MNSYHFSHPSHLAHKHSSAYSPSTKSSDISRLLDPSYASSPSSPSHYSQTKVYVDHNGLFHDPDYRDFPVAVNKNKQQRNSSTYSSEFKYYSRPSWQLTADEVEDDEDEDSKPSPSRSSFSRQQAMSYRSYSPSTSPSSYSSSDSWLSSDHSTDFHDSEKGKCTVRKLVKGCRRTSIDSTLSYSTSDSDDDEEEEDASEVASVTSASSSGCKNNLKKEWASMALTVQVGMFRMKKKVKQALDLDRA